MNSTHTLTDGHVTARVAAQGAELTSLQGDDGHEYLWSGSAWPWHAPVLFPQICRANDDLIDVAGWRYPMPHHGFARNVFWDVREHHADRLVMTTLSDVTSRRRYPFEFELEARFSISGGVLTLAWELVNTDSQDLPFMLGWHPGFRWPLDGTNPDEHYIDLSHDEGLDALTVQDNLLAPAMNGLTVNQQIAVRPDTFDHGGLILRDCRSRHLVYRGAGRAVEMSWDGFPTLTVYSPPTGGYLCLEPWAGLPEVAGQPVPFDQRDSIHVLAPGRRWTGTCVVRPRKASVRVSAVEQGRRTVAMTSLVAPDLSNHAGNVPSDHIPKNAWPRGVHPFGSLHPVLGDDDDSHQPVPVAQGVPRGETEQRPS